MSQQAAAPKVQPGQYLAKAGLKALLDEYAPPPGQTASSFYVRPGELRQETRQGMQQPVGGSDAEDRAWRERIHQLDGPVGVSDTGMVGLRSGDRGLAIIPPFPVAESRLYPSWEEAPLWAILEAERVVGVVLLRLGRFSVAVFNGGRLKSAKTDARYVKGRHQAGGTSQKRFQRVREGQMRRLYDKTCEAVRDQFGSLAGGPDYVLLGGEKFTLDGFMKVCPFMEQWRSRTLGRRLNVRDPKRDTLEQVALMLTESRVYPVAW